MILPDINLLVHAHNLRAPHHAAARAWWESCLQGQQGIALAWAVIHGFIRLTTHPKVFQNPLPVADALARVEEWLSLPHVQIAHPPQTHFQTWSGLLQQLGSAGNLTTDSHLAALAIDRGLILHTTDADFSRFPGLKWVNPLSG